MIDTQFVNLEVTIVNIQKDSIAQKNTTTSISMRAELQKYKMMQKIKDFNLIKMVVLHKQQKLEQQ